MSADPGCGKSVLSKSLVDVDLKSTESRTTCYFFFKDDDDKQKSVTAALSALLHQLFSQKGSLVRYALPDYETEGSKLPQSFHKLWTVLIKAAADSEAGEIVCILDAIDECEESGRYNVINAVNTFYSDTVSSSNQNVSKLKFLITSRPYVHIQRQFMALTRNFPTIHLRGEEESDAIGREIDTVIKWRVSKLGPELGLDESEQYTVEKELSSMTHRTYLWLTLILNVIRNEIGLTKKKLQRIVGTIPETVEQAYEAILSRANDQKRARKLLHIVVAAVRPLSLHEMNIALAIEDHHRSYEDLDLEKEATFGTTVRNLCGLFVSIIDERVYLIHQTAKEFLVATDETHARGWKHSLVPVESELLLSKICVTYLMFHVFEEEHSWDPFSTVRLNIESLVNIHHLLGYAARFWPEHFRKAQSRATNQLISSALDICDTQCRRFQIWARFQWKALQGLHFKQHRKYSTLLASHFGHETVVKLLLDKNQADINSKDDHSRTPLSRAAENGSEEVVRLLLDHNADVESKDGYGRTPLLLAVENRHEEVVKLLLDHNAAVESKSKDGWTPLSLAAINGQQEVVKLLLDHKADVESKDGYGRTPLSRAAGNGHERVVKLLLDHKAEVESKDDYGCWTPLLFAAENGHEEVVKLLLDHKAEAESKDRYGRTPLSRAAGNGHERVVKLLLDHKAEVESKDEYGRTPLSWAASGGNEGIAKLLLDLGKAEAEPKDESGRTPLSYAAGGGNEGIAKLLLDVGKAEAESKDEDGRTPLFWASRRGHEGMVKLLLNVSSAAIDLKNRHGRTPLWQAAISGHLGVVKLLLDTGKTKADIVDNTGQTLLDFLFRGVGIASAFDWRRYAIIQLLNVASKSDLRCD